MSSNHSTRPSWRHGSTPCSVAPARRLAPAANGPRHRIPIIRLALKVLAIAPGVAIHELGHVLLCRLSGVAVRRTVLFQVGTPAGFVTHAAPRLLRQHLAISSGPLLVSSALAAG